ncbi:MAG: serine/threonine-protein kinase [Pseudomonadota bacterium]
MTTRDGPSSDPALALFEAVLDCPEGERQAFLDAACAEDHELRDRVAALLAADAQTSTVLDVSLADLAAAMPSIEGEEEAPSSAGQRIGPYTLLEELGRGGMGAVYLAERSDVGKRVALKLVVGGLAAPERRARFLLERRVLAKLQHPGIASLLDAGVAKDSTPWFAMELIEGAPFDHYCDHQRLPVAERLALFEQVLEAVAYAHRNFVVHRDLKPSNILVTPSGAPKLLDFGIARLLEDDSQSIALTQSGIAPMTPDFAAPEQVLGQPIGPPTDVYQLGILLYELLCGSRPYRFAGHSASAIERRIVHEVPARPSTVATRTLDKDTELTPQQLAALRGTDPRRLRQRLAGELDAIVMKALAKEPERRYDSAEAFLEDIRRYRSGRPVAARPDTLSYRSRKFIARHPVSLAFSATLLALLAGFMTVHTVRVTAERNIAQLEARKAERVSDFLVDLFVASDPFSATSERIDEMSVREFMENRAARVVELEDQPEVQLDVLNTVSKMFQSMNVFEQALPLREQAVRVATSLYDSPHPRIAFTESGLGELYRNVGRYEDAETLFRRSLREYEALGLGRTLAASSVLTGLGEVLRQQGRLAEAEGFYADALALRREAYPDGDPALTQSMNNYALILWRKGRPAAAEPIFREALAAYRRQLSGDHPRIAAVLHNMGLVYRDLGRYEDALAAATESLTIKRARLGDDHWRMANAYRNLAGIHHAKGELAVAEARYREAMATRVAAVGEEHIAVHIDRISLADVLRDRGALTTADTLYLNALAWLESNARADHPGVAEACLGYGRSLLNQERVEEATVWLERAHAIRLERYGTGHLKVARVTGPLGAVRTAQGRYAQAEALLRSTLTALKADCHAPGCTLQTLQSLVMLYNAWGKPTQAREYQAQLTGEPSSSSS